MKYTEEELFNSANMIVEDDTIIDRFTCCLVCKVNGSEEVVGKRRFKIKDLKGQGYIGFDAYNHNVKQDITDRIRITYVGKDFIVVFVRCPAQGNVPTMHVVSFDNNNLEIVKDCGNGVTYHLITRVKKPGIDPDK